MAKLAPSLSDRDIERLKPGTTALRKAVGGGARGLMLSVNPSGRRTFYQTFRDSNGKLVWFMLGDWTGEDGADVEWARNESTRIRTMVKAGGDPRQEREARIREREEEARRQRELDSRPTWEGLIDLYVERAKGKLKPKTLSWVVDLVEAHLDPTFRERHAEDAVLYPPHVRTRKRRKAKPAPGAKALAGRLVVDLQPGDMIALHDTIKESGGVVADRCIAIVRKAFQWARIKGWRVDNPAAKLGITPSGKARGVILDGQHLQALGAALDRVEAAGSVAWQGTALVRLLLATGLRLSEVLTLKWSEVDLDRGVITKTDHKTADASGDLVQPLSADALGILRAIAARPGARLGQLVLPADLDARKPFPGARKAWATICEEAKLEGFHLHDLRRTFASWGKLAGVDLLTVSKLLNHSDVKVTAKVYAQVDLGSRRDGSNKIADAIGAAMRRAK